MLDAGQWVKLVSFYPFDGDTSEGSGNDRLRVGLGICIFVGIIGFFICFYIKSKLNPVVLPRKSLLRFLLPVLLVLVGLSVLSIVFFVREQEKWRADSGQTQNPRRAVDP